MWHHRPRGSGFTLIELMVVVALIATVLALAAPSFRDFILMQRLKGINAQLVTDLQYARSEAVSRAVPVHFRFQIAPAPRSMSCYVMYTSPAGDPCDCTLDEGLRCGVQQREVRTVQVPTDLSVVISAAGNPADRFSFDPRTGGRVLISTDFLDPISDDFLVHVYIDAARKLRDTVPVSGRVQVCIPASSNVGGTACL